MNDDQIRKNREELQRRLPKDCRTDAANDHVDAMRVVERITGHINTNPDSLAFDSFLSGWDAAMEIRSEELLEEHTALHGIICDYQMDKLRKERPEDFR